MTPSRTEALSSFLDALDEWGCEDNMQRAEAIIAFVDGGYDLSPYRDGFQLIKGGRKDD